MDVTSKIIAQFVRDLSFENPKGAGSFYPGGDAPSVKANVDVNASRRGETNLYDIELHVSVKGSKNDEHLYLIDLRYVGVFEIQNLNDDIREAYLLVECPRQLFPFARRIIFDLHSDGALAPLLLEPMNFAKLYENRKKKN